MKNYFKQNHTTIELALFPSVKSVILPALSSFFPKTILHHAADEKGFHRRKLKKNFL